MDIVIIGTGNTATILGLKFKTAGHKVVQVYGRNEKAANDLACKLDSKPAGDPAHLNLKADLYLLAVSDNAVEEVVNSLPLPDSIIVHTAASVSKNVLGRCRHYGVFYPLQTLKKDTSYLPDTPIIIDASDEKTFQSLNDLAKSITGNIIKADDEQRMKLHLAAVFTNNFVNYLYALAQDYCQKEGLEFKLLLPLIQETALRIHTIDPSDAQTGPAVRHDSATIKNHEALLKNYPDLKKFYLLFTESIWNQKK